VPLAALAAEFKVSRSTVSAIAHLHAHIPDGVLRISLPPLEFSLLVELADDDHVPLEQVASEILLDTIRSRVW
jgi:hypothetical protein